MKTDRKIDWYLDNAKVKQSYNSDRQLSQALGYKSSTVHYLRNGRAFPSDELMLKLAELAGVDPYIALLDLNTWRTTGKAKQAYADILQKISMAIVAAIGLNVATSSAAYAFAPIAAAALPGSPVMIMVGVCILCEILCRDACKVRL